MKLDGIIIHDKDVVVRTIMLSIEFLNIDLLKLLFCIPFIVYGCYSDIKTRSVPNKVWLFMLPGAVIFFLIDLSNNFLTHITSTLLSTGTIFSIAYIFFRLGFLGGADVKALTIISFILPLFPQFTLAEHTFPLLGLPVIPLFAVAVFYNAAILGAVIFPTLLIWNLLHHEVREFLYHPHYFFLGYRTDIQNITHIHAKLLENYIEEGGEIKPVFSKKGIEITDEVQRTLLNLAKKGKIENWIWVTPTIPYIIHITLGFLIAALIGDVLFWTVQQIW